MEYLEYFSLLSYIQGRCILRNYVALSSKSCPCLCFFTEYVYLSTDQMKTLSILRQSFNHVFLIIVTEQNDLCQVIFFLCLCLLSKPGKTL